MKTPLALLNLLHDRVRTAVALAGVAFAVIMILMQLGFYFSVVHTATKMFEVFEYDLLIVPKSYQMFARPGRFPMERLTQAAAGDGVLWARPLYVSLQLWRHGGRDSKEEGTRRGILVMAVRPEHDVVRLPAIRDQQHKLIRPGTVLTDKLSRREFGPLDPSVDTELGPRAVEVVGQYELGGGFGSDGTVFTSDLTFTSLFPGWGTDSPSLGLVRLRDGADVPSAVRQLNALLPDDVEVVSRRDMDDRERNHWLNLTSVGVIFGFGVVIAVIVGIAIVYQVLASDIANHLPEYATLKAMGYGPRYLAGVVLQQAVIVSVVGYVPGLLVSIVLYRFTEYWTSLSMEMTVSIAAGVLVASVLMCACSGVASLQKVTRADPADLF